MPDPAFIDTDRLQRTIDRFAARRDTGGVAFAMAQPRTGWSWQGAGGHASAGTPMTVESPYFIASATKLYTAALVLQLVDERRLALEDRIADRLPAADVSGLHVLDGVDRSDQITVEQLLAHTSGLADYFEQRQDDRTRLIDTAIHEDRGWTYEQALEIAKARMLPSFPPGTPGRAHYSDTNYQLLGRIVENACDESLVQRLQTRILDPLGLTRTFMHTPETLERYPEAATMRYGRHELRVPRFMASFWADGGMVSTAPEGLTFLRAFVAGELFAASHLTRMTAVWRPIFRPLEYGIGIMRFRLPRYYSPLKPVPAAIGHSGASGTVLFHFPDIDLYVSGTVNQAKNRSLPYRLMMRLVLAST